MFIYISLFVLKWTGRTERFNKIPNSGISSSWKTASKVNIATCQTSNSSDIEMMRRLLIFAVWCSSEFCRGTGTSWWTWSPGDLLQRQDQQWSQWAVSSSCMNAHAASHRQPGFSSTYVVWLLVFLLFLHDGGSGGRAVERHILSLAPPGCTAFMFCRPAAQNQLIWAESPGKTQSAALSGSRQCDTHTCVSHWHFSIDVSDRDEIFFDSIFREEKRSVVCVKVPLIPLCL